MHFVSTAVTVCVNQICMMMMDIGSRFGRRGSIRSGSLGSLLRVLALILAEIQSQKTIIRFDVTVRSADEVTALRAEVEAMKKQVHQAEIDMHRFSLYAAENLRMYDDLKRAKELLDRAGIDSSFIRLAPLYKA